MCACVWEKTSSPPVFHKSIYLNSYRNNKANNPAIPGEGKTDLAALVTASTQVLARRYTIIETGRRSDVLAFYLFSSWLFPFSGPHSPDSHHGGCERYNYFFFPKGFLFLLSSPYLPTLCPNWTYQTGIGDTLDLLINPVDHCY